MEGRSCIPAVDLGMNMPAVTISLLKRRYLGKMATIDNDPDGAIEVTLRVRRKDWPESLIRGDDVDFNTAVFERIEERAEARAANQIFSLQIEIDNLKCELHHAKLNASNLYNQWRASEDALMYKNSDCR